METLNFKALAYQNIYVDTRLLGKGIYQASIPKLYTSSISMKNVIKEYKESLDFLQITGESKEQFLKNLELCQLIPVTLNSL